VYDAAPPARFGSLVAADLRDVTSDPAALDSAGFWAVVADFDGALVCARFGDVRRAPVPAPRAWQGPAPADWTSSLDRTAYTAGVRRIREYIAAGKVYQANLCRVMSAPLPDPETADVDELTALPARGNPAPYAGTVRPPAHGVEVATASPELFLRRDGRSVESGPIKGTGRTADDLLEKEHAENVMIVDLVRNDLGRVCATGSVTVPALCTLEQHPGLVHMVSTVRGELDKGAGWPELLAGTFPPGSVTGAPKSSALRVIDVLRWHRLGRRRPRDRRTGRGNPHLLDRPFRPWRPGAALRHRRRHHLGIRAGAGVDGDRAEGIPAAGSGVGAASGAGGPAGADEGRRQRHACHVDFSSMLLTAAARRLVACLATVPPRAARPPCVAYCASQCIKGNREKELRPARMP
jgi:para-aminobenzoate synthetase component 1